MWNLGWLPVQADELVAWSAALFITVVVVILMSFVLNKTVKLFLGVEVGLWLLSIGLAAASDPLITSYAGTQLSIALRGCFIAGGIAMVVLAASVAWRRRYLRGCPMRRVTDSLPMPLDVITPRERRGAGDRRRGRPQAAPPVLPPSQRPLRAPWWRRWLRDSRRT